MNSDISERSFTPPLPSTSSEERNPQVYFMQQQLKLLQTEVEKLKQGQEVSSEKVYTWQNIPNFDPSENVITINKWIRLIDQKAYFEKLDDVIVTRFAIDKLMGRAKDWFLNSEVPCNGWTHFKTLLRNTFDIDPHAIGDIFKDAALYNSSNDSSLIEYSRKKLGKLSKLSWEIPEIHKINIVVTGITDINIRQLAFANNYRSVDELLTFLRSCDHNLRKSKANIKTPFDSEKSQLKIYCFKCNEPGHKRNNCPKKRFSLLNIPSNTGKENQYSVRKYAVACKICKKHSHLEKDCRFKKQINMLEQHSINLFYKDVFVNNNKYCALIDTGSECSLIRKSVVDKLSNCVKTKKCRQFVKSISGETIAISSELNCKVKIDLIDVEEKFLIVPDQICPCDVLIGNSLIKRPDIAMVKQGYEIKLFENPKGIFPVVNYYLSKNRSADIFDDNVCCVGNYKPKLLELLRNFRNCIAFDLSEMGKTNFTEMQIELTTDQPVIYHPYRLSEERKQKMRELISDLLKHNIIRESSSVYASPAILVPKGDGSLRLCIDFRKLNKITVKRKFPLPIIEEQIDKLCNYTVFTSLDLYSGYYQIPMAKNSISKTAFITPEGKYEFLRMCFGLCNAPYIFQRMMSTIIRELPEGTAFSYLDDVIIPARTEEEALLKTELVLKLLRKYGLTLQLKKCKFFMEKLNYLGKEISKDGVKPNQTKITALLGLNDPRDRKQLQRFLGLCGYFRRFVKNYATVVHPLTILLRKNVKWHWGPQQQDAVKHIKSLLAKRPILKIFDPILDIELHTDASSIAVAAILIQVHPDGPHPVAYFSKLCTYEQSKYHSYELETMALVFALRYFRIYLLGVQFTVFTDCSAVRASATKKDLIPRIARWWLEIQDFTFDIKYRPGYKMKHVDCLSRDSGQICKTNAIINLTECDWVKAVQDQDEKIKSILDTLQSKRSPENKNYFDNFQLKNGILYRKCGENGSKWVVPKQSRWLICKLNHDDCGHLGLEKTMSRINENYWFPQMKKFVKKYINSCLNCIYMKASKGRKQGYLHPIPKSSIPFETIHIDHLGPFVRSKKKNCYLFVMVDGFSKFVFLEAVKSTKVKHVLKALENFMSIFGSPARIISDRGSAFTSKTMFNFCKENGIKHILNAVATPRANGQCERFNATILDCLKCLSVNDKDESYWDTHVKTIQFNLNSAINKTLGESPFKVLTGVNPRDWRQAKILNIVGDDIQRTDLKTLRNKVAERIQDAQTKEKILFDKKRCVAKNYQVGQLVMVKITSIPSSGQSKKLHPVYKGPFKITAVLLNDRYVVEDMRNKRATKTVVAVDKIKPWMVLNAQEDQPIE